MKHIFVATEGLPGCDDFTVIIFTMESERVKRIRELKELAKTVAARYALTAEGQAAYAANNENYNWGDMLQDSLNSPAFQGICAENGLTIEVLASTVCNWHDWCDHSEALMKNIPVTVGNIEWETDHKEDAAALPQATELTLADPFDDIAGRLSDQYGYLVKSYSIQS